MSTRKQFFYASLFFLTIFACKTQKQQPHRYVDYQPYFDQTKTIYANTPSLKNADLDTSVQILSNFRNEVFEFKDTISFTYELGLSSGELLIDIDMINEKPPIYDTFMVVNGFLFKNELVNTFFPVIPDSFKMVLSNLTDSLQNRTLSDSLSGSHAIGADSTAIQLPADTTSTFVKVQPVQKPFYTREEILADTTRDLLDADTILNSLLADIPWKKGDSIPWFKGFNNYLIDSMLLLQTDFVYVEIFDTSRAVKHYSKEKLSKVVTEKSVQNDQFIYNDKVVFKIFYKDEEDVFVDMVRVQGGNFKIGSNEFDEDERSKQYGLNVSSFLLGKFEMTNLLFCTFMNYVHCDSLGKINQLKIIDLKSRYTKIAYNSTTGRFFVLKGYEDYPVLNVSWAGASLFCITFGGNLPSEAEWEYAAKGGVYALRYYSNENKSDYDYGFRFAGSNTMSEVGWFVDNSDGYCHQVGGLYPNQLGLYDMSGNVWEWCYDNYSSDFYKWNNSSTDPMCLIGSNNRVNRGGSWSSDAMYCRVTNRNYLDQFDYNPYLGFRYKREWNK